MGPNGPNGLRPHFLRPHQSALDYPKFLILNPLLNPKPYTLYPKHPKLLNPKPSILNP